MTYSRGLFILALLAMPALPACGGRDTGVVEAGSSSATDTDEPCSTLRCAAERIGIPIGTDLWPPQNSQYCYMSSDTGGMTQMGKITADNFNAGWIDMTGRFIEPSPGEYDFSYSDAQVEWAKKHGIEP